jgi:hypothetical protein
MKRTFNADLGALELALGALGELLNNPGNYLSWKP